MGETCSTCKWFSEDAERSEANGTTVGWCRRYPPTNSKVRKLVGYDDRGPIHTDVTVAEYATTHADWTCGEWLPVGRKVHQDLVRPSALCEFIPAKPAEPAAEG